MRRLSLILSDLFLPEEAAPGAGVAPTPELPNLQWLLRFSRSPDRIVDWRQWLLEQTASAPEESPIASVSAGERGGGRDLESTWRATPVALEARLDHVRLLDRGLLRLDESERASCCEEFARVFGPQYLLHDGGERAFFLSGLRAARSAVTDPARLLGTEIGPGLPGRDASELRRLWTEIEMWLQGAAFNSARERAGKRRVSALWLWCAASAPPLRTRVEHMDAGFAFYGGDPLIGELSRRAGGHAHAAPKQFGDVDSAAAHVVVEFAALTGAPHESLEALDANWFASARSALVAGELRQVDLVANDRHFRIGARPQWKIWRRRQPWLASLGS